MAQWWTRLSLRSPLLCHFDDLPSSTTSTSRFIHRLFFDAILSTNSLSFSLSCLAAFLARFLDRTVNLRSAEDRSKRNAPGSWKHWLVLQCNLTCGIKATARSISSPRRRITRTSDIADLLAFATGNLFLVRTARKIIPTHDSSRW